MVGIAQLVRAPGCGPGGQEFESLKAHQKNSFSIVEQGSDMVGIAQLVRAPGCGPGGRGFESHISPHKTSSDVFFYFHAIHSVNSSD